MPRPRRASRSSSAGRRLRLYASDDVVGVEIGGALKNVIAIAAGVVEGLGLGHNAMAALITRGLAEISRLACAEGGRRDTLAGLSGLGDLVLTCTGRPEPQPPRRASSSAAAAASTTSSASMHMVAEGVRTTGAALALGAQPRHRAADHRADGGGARWPTLRRSGRSADGTPQRAE